MLHVKEGIDLRKYGFKLGKEYPNSEDYIDNNWEMDEYWLIPMNPDNPDCAWVGYDTERLIWCINVNNEGRLWVEICPDNGSVCSLDLGDMLKVLKKMAEDGILEDIED